MVRRSDPEWTARDLFKAIGDGTVTATISHEVPLCDAVEAHRALESGRTQGATVMIP